MGADQSNHRRPRQRLTTISSGIAAMGTAEHFYFTVHSPKGSLTLPSERGLHLWAGEHLARAAIAAGLLEWLIERTR